MNPFVLMLRNDHEVCLFNLLMIYVFNFSYLVHSPDRIVGLELSASVSSLCLEEASSAAPSNFALAAWMSLREASAPLFADGTGGEISFEF